MKLPHITNDIQVNLINNIKNKKFDKSIQLLNAYLKKYLNFLNIGQFSNLKTDWDKFRKYLPGDDLKSIYWPAYARNRKIFIKQYQKSKEIPINILLDTSETMKFGSNISIFECAIIATALISLLASNNNELVGFFAFSDKLNKFILPSRNKLQIAKILNTLSTLTPKGFCDFITSGHQILKLIKKNSLFFLITDYFYISDEYFQDFFNLLNLFNKYNHKLIYFLIYDPNAFDILIKYKMIYKLNDKVLKFNKDFLLLAKQKLNKKRESFINELKKRRIDIISLSTNEMIPKILIQYFIERQKD
ncbi:MAG: DUF58 domain-containing protein [Candidatus Helarchaeota archaeon]